MKVRGSFIGFVGLFVLCQQCTPDLDKLSLKYGEGGSGGSAGFEDSQGGTVAGGNGEAGETSEGGTTAGAGEGGQAGSNEPSEGGSSAGGKGGSGGTGATAGTAGSNGTGGSAGTGPLPACPGDGCALITIPADTAMPAPATGYQQFVTINIDLAVGADLSDSIVTAQLRAIDFTGTTETVQLYASALPSFNFWGNKGMTVPLSNLATSTTLSMDLTDTGTGWDNKKVVSVGLLFKGGSKLATVKVLVEDVKVTIKADSTANPKYGPWLFTKSSDVNQDLAEKIPGGYSTPNVIFPNPYQAVPGTQVLWVAPTP
ncbi:MAG TPA: hypothetical protein VFK05_32340 [Polyangiaceae bacterium]|nr:hypothetical protein [Polyangiaceae bacterium]